VAETGSGVQIAGHRRPSADALPPAWVRAAEDVVDPVVAADRTWLIATLLGLLVLSVFVLLVQRAGAEDYVPASPAASSASSPAPTASPPAPSGAAAALKSSSALSSPSTTAPEDDDRVEPDPPPR